MKKFSIEKRRSMQGYIFVLPWVLGFLMFLLIPLIISFMLSIGKITELEGLQIKIIGFTNYIDLFKTNIDFVPAFIETMKTTVLWSPFVLVFALFIAILLNQEIKCRGLFRVIYFLPVLLGGGYVFQTIGGSANILQFPEEVKTVIAFYFSDQVAAFIQALISEIIRIFWKTGVQIVIFLAGLQSIPRSYYEAASVDNASSWYTLWKITLPILSPIILLNLVYTLIDSFRDTDNQIASLIVNEVFTNAQYEYGSAMGWVYFIVVFFVVAMVLLFSRKVVHYDK